MPGRALFAELAREMPAAGTCLRTKENMDALRQEWYTRIEAVAQDWRTLFARSNPPLTVVFCGGVAKARQSNA